MYDFFTFLLHILVELVLLSRLHVKFLNLDFGNPIKNWIENHDFRVYDRHKNINFHNCAKRQNWDIWAIWISPPFMEKWKNLKIKIKTCSIYEIWCPLNKEFENRHFKEVYQLLQESASIEVSSAKLEPLLFFEFFFWFLIFFFRKIQKKYWIKNSSIRSPIVHQLKENASSKHDHS